MAASTTLKGTNYTNIAAILAGTASAESFPNASTQTGTKLRACYDYFVDADTGWDLASTISMGVIPKGARVVGFIVANEAVGAAVTADIALSGTAATASEAWTDMTSANQQFIPALEAIQNTPLTADKVVQVITAGATLAAGKSITVTTLYLNED